MHPEEFALRIPEQKRKAELMKVIALLTLSLAAVVCEQQTLFAPHYVGFELRAPVPTGRRNALRPAARVNRLAPVNSSYAAAAPPRNDIWIVDTGGGLTGNGLQPTPDPSMHLPEPTPVERPVLGPIAESCPPCELEIWFGIGGNSGPGATSF